MTEPDNSCSICNRVALWRSGENPYFIHEFEHSILIVGDHQFHRGYTLLLLKEHVRELHELWPQVQSALFLELMTAARAVVAVFQPWKMNYACYGNVDPHIHWHLFPRYGDDPDRHGNPWVHATEFDRHLIDGRTAREYAERIRERLDEFL